MCISLFLTNALLLNIQPQFTLPRIHSEFLLLSLSFSLFLTPIQRKKDPNFFQDMIPSSLLWAFNPKIISSFCCLQILLFHWPQVPSSYKPAQASRILQTTLCQSCHPPRAASFLLFPLKRVISVLCIYLTTFIHSPDFHPPPLRWQQKAPNTSSLSNLSQDLSPGFGLSSRWHC